MYLKTIEMQGFKSFAEKSVISFEPGVTAIVGPNGSGKSNISDAVRWVLGEMSAKSLRGGKMEDVIFNGTARRRPASYAEVILTIDNADHGLEGYGQEVSVGRRLYRSGESEYSIDGQTVRLKDVVNLFLNTGIGKEGYSVIGQGRIAEIISQKGEERRGVFEEAAGISRYRYRKNEAQNKLNQYRDNALRIDDILKEVQSRIPQLERQSEKAMQYGLLVEERRLIEVSLLVKKLDELDVKRQESLKVFEERTAELQSLQERIDALDAEMEARYQHNQQENMVLSQKRGMLDEKVSEDAALSARISVLENDMTHYRNSVSLNQGESGVQEKQKEELALALKKSEEGLAVRLQELSVASLELTRLQETVRETEQALSAAGRDVAALDAEIAILEQSLRQAELEQRGSESANRLRGDRAVAIEKELSALRAVLAEGEASLAVAREECKKHEEETAALLTKKQEVVSKLEESRGEMAALSEKKEEKRLQKMTCQQRRETLQRMDRLMEGFSGSVKAVLSAQEDKQIGGVFGPVSKLITTDEKYITAIETTLGAGMQNIVVSDEGAAKAAIAYLKATNSGRATFLPLTTVRGRPWDDRALHGKKGFVAMASRLVRCDEKFRGVIDYLLGRTIVAENIDVATILAKEQQYQCRVVTLDGQLVNVGGSFTGGQLLHKTGILSRGGDIARLEAEEKELGEQIREMLTKLEEMDKGNAEITAQLRELDQKIALSERAAADRRNESEIQVGRCADYSARIATLEQEMNQTAQSAAFADETLKDLQGRGEAISRQIAEKKQKAAEVREREKALLSKREADVTKCTEASLGIGMDNREIERMENERRSIEEKITLLSASVEEKAEKNARLQVMMDQAEAELKEAREKLAVNAALAATLRRELSEGASRQEEAEKEGYILRGEHKEILNQKDKVYEVYTRLRSQLEEQERTAESALVKLREEHELERSDASQFAKDNAEAFAAVEEPEKRLAEVRQKLKSIGSVNPDAVEELKETKERYTFLRDQYDDVDTAAKELEKLIASLEETMRTMFLDTFSRVREKFKVCFVDLFGGGNADIVMSDENDPLNCSIDMKIQPPGKLVKTLALLSGGEQAFVAIALYFALLSVNPAPFCIFDEIESALDEANVYRFGDYLKKGCADVQFIVITHRRGTMECADTLYGITMQEKGVSDFIKLSLDEVAGRSEFAE